METEVIALFNYIFGSSEYDLTAQMGTAFSYAVKVLLSKKGSTIMTLRKLLEEDPKRGFEDSVFKDDILGLDENTIDFFRHHFYSKALVATRSQIARRIHNLIAVPAFSRMFTAGSNTLDLFDDMQRGRIVLVNTNQQLLKDDGCILFGRYIIARTMAAAFERATIPPKDRKVTHLVIDEAAPYFDKTFDALLTRVRQFNLKVLIAFQHLMQTRDELKNAILSQTSVKYAAGLSYSDARRIALEMNCDPQFIQNQEKDTADPPRWSQWAVYADGYTKSAVSLTLPFYTLEAQPMMTERQHRALLERNRTRVRSPEKPSESARVSNAKARRAEEPPDSGEPSDKWGD